MLKILIFTLLIILFIYLLYIDEKKSQNINEMFDNNAFLNADNNIKDNENNINTIIRKLIINKSDDGPKFYYKASASIYEKLSNTTPPPPPPPYPITVDETINIGTLKANLTDLIKIIDPRLALSNTYLEPSISVSEFDASYSSALIGINVINIYLSRTNIIHSTYDVSNNKFIDYFNKDGQELANISKILLDVGTYTLVYISKASTVTTRISSQYRTLTVNAVIIEEGAKPIITHCCYPKVEYKPIQDNYKLGSQNSTVMKRVKYIINRNR